MSIAQETPTQETTAHHTHDPDYNYGYLDEQTKRMIRREG